MTEIPETAHHLKPEMSFRWNSGLWFPCFYSHWPCNYMTFASNIINVWPALMPFPLVLLKWFLLPHGLSVFCVPSEVQRGCWSDRLACLHVLVGNSALSGHLQLSPEKLITELEVSLLYFPFAWFTRDGWKVALYNIEQWCELFWDPSNESISKHMKGILSILLMLMTTF